MENFKAKTIRGGAAKVFAQATQFLVRVGSLMVLARLLDPKDFGLVGMVTAFTGILFLFRDFGLSAAAVQRAKVTEEQISTLFWINLAVGAALTLVMVALAPAIAAFYHEPRLLSVAVVLASGFLINAAGVQQSALLQRQMRFTCMAAIDLLALLVSTIVGILMALRGFGYWALVATSLVPVSVGTVGFWVASGWIPGKPQRRTGMRSLLRFGGTLTLNGIVVYFTYNLDKILLGRWWGAQAVGLYGRAYQLITIPTENLNSAAGEVAFPALSRLQDDPMRLKRNFLKGYSLILALTVPITIAGALSARDLITVVLGPKWHETILIFRLLSPTILVAGMIYPLTWLVLSLGMAGRCLRMSLVYAPFVVLGCAAGLRYGPIGVAIGYSVAMMLWLIPHMAWAIHGTTVSLRDMVHTVSRPLLSGLTGAAVASALAYFYASRLSALPRLILGNAILFLVYLLMLWYVMGQQALFIDLLRGLWPSSAKRENNARVPRKSDSGLRDRHLNSYTQPVRERESTPTEMLFIASIYRPTPWGIAAYIDNLARGLIRVGRRVKVVALVEPQEKKIREFLETYEDWVIPVEVSYDKRPENWLGDKCVSLLEILRCSSPRARKILDRTRWFKASRDSVAKLAQILDKENAALVVFGHIYLRFYPLVLHLKKAGRPYGIIAHDVDFYLSKDRVNDRVLRGTIIRGAEWIAANSRSTKSLIEAWGVDETKIMIVHPPLPDEAMNIPQQQTGHEHKRVFTLITVSRVVQSKGIDIVLRALKILDGALAPYRYIVAGEGPDRAAFEKLAVELGVHEKVFFAGFVSDEEKWRLLQSADVYVMPSRVNLNEAHEGFGLAFLEAAACGIPAIGSNVGGIPDAVVDGETGKLVQPDSPEELANAILFFYEKTEKRKEMGRAARERARKQFSPQFIGSYFCREISLRSTMNTMRVDASTAAGSGSFGVDLM